jgi:hypothetical protein
MSCPYRYMFGIPGQGFHSLRLFGLAVGDVLGTLALAWATAVLTDTSFLLNFVVWFVVGEILHWYVGLQTAFLKMVGVEVTC